MNNETLRLAIASLLDDWRKAAARQGAGFWLAVHAPISKEAEEADTSVKEAYFIANGGKLETRTIAELQRFLRLRAFPEFRPSIAGASGIGYSSVAEVAGTDELYIGFQFGPLYGRGARFVQAGGKLEVARVLWLS